MLARFVRDESGATALEYGLIVAIISAAIVGGFSGAARTIGDNFLAAADVMKQSIGGP